MTQSVTTAKIGRSGLEGTGKHGNIPGIEPEDWMTDVKGYWSESPRLFALAVEAHRLGVSLDQSVEFDETARSFCATSNGSLSHLPSSRKSSVTPNLSVSK